MGADGWMIDTQHCGVQIAIFIILWVINVSYYGKRLGTCFSYGVMMANFLHYLTDLSKFGRNTMMMKG